MNITIRQATISDAIAIQILNRDEMNYDCSIELTTEKLNKLLNSQSDKIFVAVWDNNVVGYIHANNYELIFAPQWKNIMSIAVSSQHKRKGIGKALMNAVEQWAKDEGASALHLVSGETRLGAHEFYKKCGFVSKKKQLNFKKDL